MKSDAFEDQRTDPIAIEAHSMHERTEMEDRDGLRDAGLLTSRQKEPKLVGRGLEKHATIGEYLRTPWPMIIEAMEC